MFGLLIIVGLWVILPIAAWISARRAQRRVDELEKTVECQAEDINRLTNRLLQIGRPAVTATAPAKPPAAAAEQPGAAAPRAADLPKPPVAPAPGPPPVAAPAPRQAGTPLTSAEPAGAAPATAAPARDSRSR